jgi:hypothetical protein
VLTTPIGTQIEDFQGGRSQYKRGFPKRPTRVWKPRRLNTGWFWEWMWDSKSHATSLFVLWWGDLLTSCSVKCLLRSGCSALGNCFWGILPSYLPLSRGWFGFVFKNLEDTGFILGRLWDFEGGSLMLKRWCIRFNPTTEYFSFHHLWVLLSGLLL